MFSNYSPFRNPSQTGKDKFCKGKFWRFIFKEGQILDQWNGGRGVPFAFLALQVFPLIPGFSKTAGTSDANKWLICQHTSVSSPTRLTYINYIAFTRCMRAWPTQGCRCQLNGLICKEWLCSHRRKVVEVEAWVLQWRPMPSVGKEQNTHKQFETSGLAKGMANYRPLGSTWGPKTSAAIGPLHAAFSSSQIWMNVCPTGVTCTSFLGSLKLEIKEIIFSCLFIAFILGTDDLGFNPPWWHTILCTKSYVTGVVTRWFVCTKS